ncbi:protein of unknown function [Nitrospira japonica]|uniref:Uncharacterized protein n=1 Tax=Nitrospira japonica TaxID=1325564 RepID=A0A1W1I446_9BACT|nr:hypothetical protein [Nitrospira japonica]SLM47776.1 protein of unknown function [Nitrospira japonica]
MRLFPQGLPQSVDRPTAPVRAEACGKSVRLLLCTVATAVCVGCVSTGPDGPKPFDLHLQSYRERLAAEPVLSRQFRACLAQVRDSDPEADDEPITPVRALIRKVRERDPVAGDSLSNLQDLVAGLIQDKGRSLDIVSLKGVVAAARLWQERIDVEEEDLAKGASRFARLLVAYNKAYFGNLRLVEAEPPPGETAGGVRPATSVGFVDRSGRSFLFPGLPFQASLESDAFTAEPGSTATSQRIGADLTRIFIEAFFDAAFEVPAVEGATALQVDWAAERPFPELRPDQSGIPLSGMARVTRDALRVEAVVMTKVGEAVRGGSVAGTGNETLAASLETAAGVTAKKLVEHGGYCYLQVKPPATQGH